MGRQIVQDYDVAWPKSRSQLSLDVSFKNAPVHWRVNDEGGGQGVASQAGDEGLRRSRLNSWKIIAQRARQFTSATPFGRVTSISAKRMLPEVGVSSRLIIRRSVDLPAPERPITPINLPDSMSSD